MAGPGGRGGSDCRALEKRPMAGFALAYHNLVARAVKLEGISTSCRSEARGLLPSGLPTAGAPSFPLLLQDGACKVRVIAPVADGGASLGSCATSRYEGG
jgi:hypothetical protein